MLEMAGTVESSGDAAASQGTPQCSRINYSDIAEKITVKLAEQYPQLTGRERLVCGYTLAGYTAEAIGLILGVGMSTIITYRRRAYSRLGVCNANQLIAPLLI